MQRKICRFYWIRVQFPGGFVISLLPLQMAIHHFLVCFRPHALIEGREKYLSRNLLLGKSVWSCPRGWWNAGHHHLSNLDFSLARTGISFFFFFFQFLRKKSQVSPFLSLSLSHWLVIMNRESLGDRRHSKEFLSMIEGSKNTKKLSWGSTEQIDRHSIIHFAALHPTRKKKR